jgi:thiol-disulfide isomerase/thioredoxin
MLIYNLIILIIILLLVYYIYNYDNNNNYILYLYHTNWCTYCKKILYDWDNVKKNNKLKNLIFIDVDITDHNNIKINNSHKTCKLNIINTNTIPKIILQIKNKLYEIDNELLDNNYILNFIENKTKK